MSKLEAIKKRAQFFKRGSIVPTRILRCSKRKQQHTVRFWGDSWALPTKTGYLVICGTAENPNASAISVKRLKGMGHAVYNGSPYHSGVTHFIGNSGFSEEEFERAVLEMLAMKNGERP